MQMLPNEQSRSCPPVCPLAAPGGGRKASCAGADSIATNGVDGVVDGRLESCRLTGRLVDGCRLLPVLIRKVVCRDPEDQRTITLEPADGRAGVPPNWPLPIEPENVHGPVDQIALIENLRRPAAENRREKTVAHCRGRRVLFGQTAVGIRLALTDRLRGIIELRSLDRRWRSGIGARPFRQWVQGGSGCHPRVEVQDDARANRSTPADYRNDIQFLGRAWIGRAAGPAEV
jgi:hypothetical protein